MSILETEPTPTHRDRYWRREQREYAYTKRTENGWDDGHPHERDESGWCTTCMSPPGTSHSRCVAKEDT